MKNERSNHILPMSPLWVAQTLLNLPVTLTHPCVSHLFGTQVNRPALVVGPAPSLEKSLDKIAPFIKMYDPVVIAVGTALKPLVNKAIIPHYAVAIDTGKAVEEQFEGVACPDTALIANVACSPLIFDKFAVKYWFSTQNPVIEWIGMLPKESLFCGGTVACAAVDAAIRLGCDPIIILGFDFAYSNSRTYAAGTIKGNEVAGKDERLVYTAGNYEPQVCTPIGFLGYRNSVEELIACYPYRTVYNAAEGGAKVVGTQLAKLDEINIDMPCHPIVAPKGYVYPTAKDIMTKLSYALLDIDGAASALKSQLAIIDGAIHGTIKPDQDELLENDKWILHNCSDIINIFLKPVLLNRALQLKDPSDPHIVNINKRCRAYYENMLGALVYMKKTIEWVRGNL